MDIWHIRGGNKLEGTCFVQGSKNASLPIIAASIAVPARSELTNVPQLRDVDAALRILAQNRRLPVLLVDCGLDEAGRRAVSLLAGDNVKLVTPEEMASLYTEK